jgi:peptidoglycan/xylan/chitin deacetylase (PgdA/CDA1 family)
MLTFRNIKILFGLLLTALIFRDVGNDVAWYNYVVLFLLYSLILFYGSYNVSSGFYMKVLCEGSNNKKQIAISFDDGPSERYTSQIVDILDKHQVPAAFFCIGKNIGGNESMLQKIVNSNHLVGNHSYSHHFWFDMYGSSKMGEDLHQMNEAVFNAVGLRPNLFRPPYGVTNPNLAKTVKKQNLVAVGWNIRSMDTVVKDDKKLLHKVLKAVKPGAIILFHDTSEATFLMLPAFIQEVKDRGFEIVRLDKMLNITPYA